MASFDPATDRCLTAFIHIKTLPVWLAFSIEERVKHINETVRPLLEEFKDTVIYRWYDTEYYTAEVTDIMTMDCKYHFSYGMFLDKLR